MNEMINYLRSYPFGCSSDQLIEHFSENCQDEQGKFTFRQMLRQIAKFQKGNITGTGKWTLKGEYQ